MKKLTFKFATLALLASAGLGVAAHGQVTHESANVKNGVGQKTSLTPILIEALGTISSDNKTAKGCFDVLSDSTVKFVGSETEVGILRTGQTNDPSVNEHLSDRAGKIIGCSNALADSAQKIFPKFKSSRPSKNEAVKIAAAVLKSEISKDYKSFWDKSLKSVFESPVFVNNDNGGYSRPVQLFNREVATEGKLGSVGVDVLRQSEESSSREKGSMLRELAVGGIFDWRTAKPISTGKDSYSVSVKVSNVEVKRNGQHWFDSETVGGSSYWVDLTSDRGSGTNFKREQ